MFKKKVVEKSKHTFYVQQILSESRTFYEIMWRNMVQPDRPHMTVEYGACALRAE
jgi:hypothetical protein